MPDAHAADAQLSVLERQKQQLERELAHEHEEHAQAMQRLGAAFTDKLTERSRLKNEKVQLENALEAEQELILHRMGAQVQALLLERGRLKRDNDRLRAEVRLAGGASFASPAASPRSTPASSPRRHFAEPPPAALH